MLVGLKLTKPLMGVFVNNPSENSSLAEASTDQASSHTAQKVPAEFAAKPDLELVKKLDNYSLESVVELKISRFLDQIGRYYPENMYNLIMTKIEKPLLQQILRRTGGNQVHASKILGINRNTLRKKMKLYEIS